MVFRDSASHGLRVDNWAELLAHEAPRDPLVSAAPVRRLQMSTMSACSLFLDSESKTWVLPLAE